MSVIDFQPDPTHAEESMSNIDRVRSMYERWSETKGASSDEFLGLFAEDTEMRSVLEPYEGGDRLAGHRDGIDKARQYFETLAQDWNMISYDVDRYIVDPDGDDIVMVGRCHWRHRQSGNEVDTPKVDIWHFEDGKATSFFEMFDSLAFAEAVGATSIPQGPVPEGRKLPQPKASLGNPNLPALQKAYATWSETKGGNAREVLDLFAPGVTMRSVLSRGQVPSRLAGEHSGTAGAQEYFDELTSNWKMQSFTVDRYIADGDDIVMIGRCHWRSLTGKGEFDTPKVDISHFDNGKVTDFLEFFDTLAVARAVAAA